MKLLNKSRELLNRATGLYLSNNTETTFVLVIGLLFWTAVLGGVAFATYSGGALAAFLCILAIVLVGGIASLVAGVYRFGYIILNGILYYVIVARRYHD